jgi:hypothetical protein
MCYNVVVRVNILVRASLAHYLIISLPHCLITSLPDYLVPLLSHN